MLAGIVVAPMAAVRMLKVEGTAISAGLIGLAVAAAATLFFVDATPRGYVLAWYFTTRERAAAEVQQLALAARDGLASCRTVLVRPLGHHGVFEAHDATYLNKRLGMNAHWFVVLEPEMSLAAFARARLEKRPPSPFRFIEEARRKPDENLTFLTPASPAPVGACAVKLHRDTGPLVSMAQLRVDPPGLRSCDPPVSARLSWDATPSRSEAVKLFVISEDGSEKLVTLKGTTDSVVTGPWARAQQTFILRDAQTQQELTRLTIPNAGDQCS
jgi:hypothetical protein